jgi:hypothetical protein
MPQLLRKVLQPGNNIREGGALVWVVMPALLHENRQLLRTSGRDARTFPASQNSSNNLNRLHTIIGNSTRINLPEDNPKTENIRLFRIVLRVNDFGSHPVISTSLHMGEHYEKIV